MWDFLLLILKIVLVFYFTASLTIQIVLLTSAGLELLRQSRLTRGERTTRLLASEATPSISLIAPAYNEAETIEQSVRSLLTLRYPRLQVIVVNDGSADATVAILRRAFQLRRVPETSRRAVRSAPITAVYRSERTPNLVVVDKVNGGKADALNAGLNVADGELICAVDADTIIERDGLLRLVRPFLSDEGTLASGGTIRVANGCVVRAGRVVRVGLPHSLLGGIQVVEYLRAFTFGRLGWNRLGGNLIVSGAFGLFRRDLVLEAGGYLEETVGEDMELVVRLRRLARERREPDRVPFVPDAVAWTEVPERLRILGRQRDRWQRGLADVMVRHRRTVANPRYGRMGLLSMPAFFLLDLLGPLFEVVVIALVVLGLTQAIVDPEFLILILILGYGCAIPLSLAAVVMDQYAYHTYPRWGDRLRLIAWCFLENLGYRQFMAGVRIWAMVRWTLGAKGWGEMSRSGFSTEER